MIDSAEFRKKLHALAELSGEEKISSQTIAEDLREIPSFSIKQVGGYSILASSSPSGGFLLRADIDALPISEEHLNLQYASKNLGVSHKCGHDGHSAILRGTAHEISNLLIKKPIHFLFQASEENGKGAPAVLNDNYFKNVAPDFAFGMHNIPGKPLAEVLVKKGIITTAVVTLIIRIHGVSAHASSPEKGISPIPVITGLLTFNQELLQQKSKYALITPTYIIVGTESNGTAPGDAQINLTIRCHETSFLVEICQDIQAELNRICNAAGLKFSVDEEDRFDACLNDSTAVDLLLDASYRAGLEVNMLDEPFPFGEDFGAYSQVIPSCFFGLGAGINQPPLHHPDYDFPDELIEPAVKLWRCLINKDLNYIL
jgi:amidohydrolase